MQPRGAHVHRMSICLPPGSHEVTPTGLADTTVLQQSVSASCFCLPSSGGSHTAARVTDMAATNQMQQPGEDFYGFSTETLSQQQAQARAACSAYEACRLAKWQVFASSKQLPTGATLKRYCRKVGCCLCSCSQLCTDNMTGADKTLQISMWLQPLPLEFRRAVHCSRHILQQRLAGARELLMPSSRFFHTSLRNQVQQHCSLKAKLTCDRALCWLLLCISSPSC